MPTPSSSDLTVPRGIRIASTLCYFVGGLTILITVALAIPVLAQPNPPLLLLGANLFGGALACAAGYLVRAQSRIGGFLVVLAWAFPSVVLLLSHEEVRAGPLFLLIAMIYTLTNWKHLR